MKRIKKGSPVQIRTEDLSRAPIMYLFSWPTFGGKGFLRIDGFSVSISQGRQHGNALATAPRGLLLNGPSRELRVGRDMMPWPTNPRWRVI